MTYTVFITGSDKGLGLSLARRFLQADFQVFAGKYLTDENLRPLGEQYPNGMMIIPLDVSDINSINQAAEKVVRQTPALDVLINNAGIHLPGSKNMLEELDLTGSLLEQTMTVNAFGPLRVTQKLLPLLRRGTLKRIVNISSEAGSIGDCDRTSWFPYCMSKSALNMQVKILHNYLASDGFKVLAIHPGWMRTDMGGPEAPLQPDDAADAIFRLTQGEPRLGEPIFLDYQGKTMSW